MTAKNSDPPAASSSSGGPASPKDSASEDKDKKPVKEVSVVDGEYINMS